MSRISKLFHSRFDKTRIRNFVDAKRDFARDVYSAKRELWRREKRLIRRFFGLGKKKPIQSPTRSPRPFPPPPSCSSGDCSPRPSPPLPPAPPPPPSQAEPLRPQSNDPAVAAPGQSCVLAPKRTCEWVAYKTVCKQVEDKLCAQQQQVNESYDK